MARNKYPEETVQLILDVSEKLFLQKGYDATSIQDIINGLGGLSKGAVYHHFKSKEEIFDAVGDRYSAAILEELQQTLHDSKLTGLEKLKKMFRISLADSNQDLAFVVTPSLLDNPKLLALQIREIFQDLVPHYTQPVMEEGIADGSIKTEYPKELSEVLLLITNIWMNPCILQSDEESQRGKARFLQALFKNFGIDLLDDEMLETYVRYCRIFQQNHDK
ncbi:MAG: TetR/AcrR family transcriptional regulator [Lachnospiraceae bacterium]|nr:TetR/AcrR family transcriptional regulator [Lachnospiraceae bacterium]